jgi:hypothetical protein
MAFLEKLLKANDSHDSFLKYSVFSRWLKIQAFAEMTEDEGFPTNESGESLTAGKLLR